VNPLLLVSFAWYIAIAMALDNSPECAAHNPFNWPFCLSVDCCKLTFTITLVKCQISVTQVEERPSAYARTEEEVLLFHWEATHIGRKRGRRRGKVLLFNWEAACIGRRTGGEAACLHVCRRVGPSLPLSGHMHWQEGWQCQHDEGDDANTTTSTAPLQRLWRRHRKTPTQLNCEDAPKMPAWRGRWCQRNDFGGTSAMVSTVPSQRQWRCQRNNGNDTSTTPTANSCRICQRDEGDDASATTLTLAAPAQRSRLCCYVVIVLLFRLSSPVHGFQRGIEWRNRIRYVIFVVPRGASFDKKRNSKEIWREVVLTSVRCLRGTYYILYVVSIY
jgi:hypothetical protein